MDSFSCKRRSIGARTSSIGGHSEVNYVYFLATKLLFNKQAMKFYLVKKRPMSGGDYDDILLYNSMFYVMLYKGLQIPWKLDVYYLFLFLLLNYLGV